MRPKRVGSSRLRAPLWSIEPKPDAVLPEVVSFAMIVSLPRSAARALQARSAWDSGRYRARASGPSASRSTGADGRPADWCSACTRSPRRSTTGPEALELHRLGHGGDGMHGAALDRPGAQGRI